MNVRESRNYSHLQCFRAFLLLIFLFLFIHFSQKSYGFSSFQSIATFSLIFRFPSILAISYLSKKKSVALMIFWSLSLLHTHQPKKNHTFKGRRSSVFLPYCYCNRSWTNHQRRLNQCVSYRFWIEFGPKCLKLSYPRN